MTRRSRLGKKAINRMQNMDRYEKKSFIDKDKQTYTNKTELTEKSKLRDDLKKNRMVCQIKKNAISLKKSM